MVERILNSKAKTITLAAVLVAGSTLVSGLLGVVKMRLLAGRFDVGFTLDSYFAAFRIPDLISATLITGGIIVSFLPLFSQNFQKDRKKAWELANNMVNVSLFGFAAVCVAIWIFAPQLVDLIAPGFPEAQKELTVSLARIMFVSPLIFAISGIFSGILHHFDRFVAYAIAPILYNLGIIFGIVFLADLFGEGKEVHGVAWGVVIGSLMHLVIQVPSVLRSGYRYKFVFAPRSPDFVRIIRLVGPRMVSQASSQINLIVITAIASLLTAGSVAVFNFANNLYLFPVAIVGVSFATAAFPSFSRSMANGNVSEFAANFSSTFRQIIFVMVPLSAMILILRAQIVRLVLGAGEFGWTETRLTAAALGVFAFAMIFAALLPLVVRAFFAFQDTRTPAMASIAAVIFNILLSFIFVFAMKEGSLLHGSMAFVFKLSNIDDIRVVGLAAALSIATAFQLIILFRFLIGKMGSLPLAEMGRSAGKVAIAAVVMAFVSYLALRVAVLFVQLTTFWAVFLQASFAFLLGVVAYLTVLHLLDSAELRRFRSLVSEKIIGSIAKR